VRWPRRALLRDRISSFVATKKHSYKGPTLQPRAAKRSHVLFGQCWQGATLRTSKLKIRWTRPAVPPQQQKCEHISTSMSGARPAPRKRTS